MIYQNVVGSFSVGTLTQSAGTAIVRLIPPFCGAPGASPKLFAVDTGMTMQNSTQTALTGYPNWWTSNDAFSKVTDFSNINGATAHAIVFMRPLNWTYVASAAAINQAVINIKEDPGIYSTKYRYPSPLATGTAAVADNGIAANDYCAYQLKDGTWVVDTVASVSTLAITMATAVPNITGGGVAAGSPFFFFGISTDKDPATGLAHPGFTTTASSTQFIQTQAGAMFNTLHRGDPMIIFNANGSNADTLAGAWGVYTKDW